MKNRIYIILLLIIGKAYIFREMVSPDKIIIKLKNNLDSKNINDNVITGLDLTPYNRSSWCDTIGAG